MQKWHIFFRNNLCNDTLVPVTACHLVANAQLTFAGDIDLHLLDDARINVVATLDAIKRALLFEIQLSEFVFKRTDYLMNLVSYRARIDVDMIVNTSQFPQQRLGYLSVRRNNDFTCLSVDHVERNLFT